MTVKTKYGNEAQSVEVLRTYDIDAEVGGMVWEIDEMPDYPLLPTLLVLDTDPALHNNDIYRTLVGELDYMCAFVSDLKHYDYPTFANPLGDEFIDPDDYLYSSVRFDPDRDIWVVTRWE